VEDIFEKAVDEINGSDYEMYDEFALRLSQILYDTGGIGWGFSDEMTDIYDTLRFLEDEAEDETIEEPDDE